MPEGCPQEAGFVAGYLDGDWDGDVRRRFEEHVESCERCARKKRELVVVREALGSWEQPRLDDSEVEEYREAFRKALPTTCGRTWSDAVGRRPFGVAAWCAAAGVVGAISMAVFQVVFGSPGIRSDGAPVSAAAGGPGVSSEDDRLSSTRSAPSLALPAPPPPLSPNAATSSPVGSSSMVVDKSVGILRYIAGGNAKDKRQRAKVKAVVGIAETYSRGL